MKHSDYNNFPITRARKNEIEKFVWKRKTQK